MTQNWWPVMVYFAGIFCFWEIFCKLFLLQKAMLAHYTQLEWFRLLYIIFSRYMTINSFTRLDLKEDKLEETDWNIEIVDPLDLFCYVALIWSSLAWHLPYTANTCMFIQVCTYINMHICLHIFIHSCLKTMGMRCQII